MHVLVLSCDKYADAWEVFFHLLFKFWPQCPYPITLCSDELKFEHQNVRNFNPGQNKTWSEILLLACQQVEEEHVLVLQEDFLINKKVDQQMIAYYLKFMKNYQAASFRLFPAPGPTSALNEDMTIGRFATHDQWRVSCQATIWNKQDLISLIDPTESIQEFEVLGTNRSSNHPKPFLGIIANHQTKFPDDGEYPLTYICTGIIQRRWTKRAIRFLNTQGLQPDYSKRGVSTYFSAIYYFLQFRKSYVPWYINVLLHGMDFSAYRINKYFGIDLRTYKPKSI